MKVIQNSKHRSEKENGTRLVQGYYDDFQKDEVVNYFFLFLRRFLCGNIILTT